MPGLRGNAGGDDDDIRAVDGGVVVRPDIGGIEALDRRALCEIQRLALRNAFDDVEKHDITEFLQTDQQRQRPSDMAGTDESNLLSSHSSLPQSVSPTLGIVLIRFLFPKSK